MRERERRRDIERDREWKERVTERELEIEIYRESEWEERKGGSDLLLYTFIFPQFCDSHSKFRKNKFLTLFANRRKTNI